MGTLRLLLALSVVAAHSNPILGSRLLGGVGAVQTFYMISGFYMALVLSTKYKLPGSYWFFIKQRARRLYPLYWLVLGLYVAYFRYLAITRGVEYGTLGLWQTHGKAMDLAASLFLAFSQITIIGQDLCIFLRLNGTPESLTFSAFMNQGGLPAYQFMYVPPAWTVALEIMFYCCAPFLNRLRTQTLLIVMACSVALRLALHFAGYGTDPWTYRFFPNELVFFVAGMIAYRAYNSHKAVWGEHKRAIFSGFTLLCAAMVGIGFTKVATSESISPVLILFYIAALTLLPGLFAVSKSNKIDKVLGELSYPIYLSHLLTLMALRKYLGHTPPFLNGAAGALACVIVAVILYVGFERYIERWRAREYDKEILPSPPPPERAVENARPASLTA